MSGSVLRYCVIPVTVVLLGAGSALADIAAPPDSVDGAYGVLERLGLLQNETGAAPRAVPAPARTDPQRACARKYGLYQSEGRWLAADSPRD